MLDMGEPVRIDRRRRASWPSSASRPVDIVYTGLRPGEKLHEELFGAGERDVRPLHPLISHVQVPPLDPHRTRHLDPGCARAELVADLARLCGERGTPVDVVRSEANPSSSLADVAANADSRTVGRRR